MKTITYNPETHALVSRDLIADAKQIFCSDVEPNTNGDCIDVIEWFSAMIAAAPQPEPNPNWCAGCSPDNCSGCGTFYEIKKQRDELLAAMEKCRKELLAWMRDHGDDLATQEAVADARVAIAIVKGEQ